MNRIEVLKQNILFKNWDLASLTKLAETCVDHVLGRGQSVFFEGESPTSLYIIAQGTAAVKKSVNGDDNKVADFSKNQHFGEIGILLDGKRSATVDMTEAGEVLEIPYSSIKTLMLQNPAVGMFFYQNLAESLATRISRTTEDLVGLKNLRLKHT